MGAWGPQGVNGIVVVITGAARGIGADAARGTPPGAERSEGCADLPGAEDFRKTVESCGPDATAWDTDVTSCEQLAAVQAQQVVLAEKFIHAGQATIRYSLTTSPARGVAGLGRQSGP